MQVLPRALRVTGEGSTSLSGLLWNAVLLQCTAFLNVHRHDLLLPRRGAQALHGWRFPKHLRRHATPQGEDRCAPCSHSAIEEPCEGVPCAHQLVFKLDPLLTDDTMPHTLNYGTLTKAGTLRFLQGHKTASGDGSRRCGTWRVLEAHYSMRQGDRWMTYFMHEVCGVAI